MKNKELTIKGEIFRFLTPSDIEKLAEKGPNIDVRAYFGLEIKEGEEGQLLAYTSSEEILVRFNQLSYQWQPDIVRFNTLYKKCTPELRETWENIAAVICAEKESVQPNLYNFSLAVMNYTPPKIQGVISRTQQDLQDIFIHDGEDIEDIEDIFHMIEAFDRDDHNQLFNYIRQYETLLEHDASIGDIEHLIMEINNLYDEPYDTIALLQRLLQKKRQ